jgi:CheY-like chemotaxis protein
MPPVSLINRILLIDDDDVNNFINTRLLKKLSVSDDIKISTNGEEGLKYLHYLIDHSAELPDLILLDINMPVMDGFEFLQRFTEIDLDQKRPVVVMLTTSSNEKDINQIGRYSQVAGFLNKPLTEDKIRSVLADHFVDKPANTSVVAK